MTAFAKPNFGDNKTETYFNGLCDPEHKSPPPSTALPPRFLLCLHGSSVAVATLVQPEGYSRSYFPNNCSLHLSL